MSGVLSNSPSEIIAYLVINLGKGTNPNASSSWPVYVDFSPESPDNLIVINTEAGRLSGKDHVEGDVPEHVGFQVAVRSSSFSSGEQKARDIAITFDEQVSQKLITISGTSYIISSITRRSSVINPTRNISNSRRNLFTFHATTTIRQV